MEMRAFKYLAVVLIRAKDFKGEELCGGGGAWTRNLSLQSKKKRLQGLFLEKGEKSVTTGNMILW